MDSSTVSRRIQEVSGFGVGEIIVVLLWWLDMMIFKVSSKLNDSLWLLCLEKSYRPLVHSQSYDQDKDKFSFCLEK